MNNQARIIVIVGVSTLYHLAKAGETDALLLEATNSLPVDTAGVSRKLLDLTEVNCLVIR